MQRRRVTPEKGKFGKVNIDEWRKQRPDELKDLGVNKCLERFRKLCPEKPSKDMDMQKWQDGLDTFRSQIKSFRDEIVKTAYKLEASSSKKDKEKAKAYWKSNEVLTSWEFQLKKHEENFKAEIRKLDGTYQKDLHELAEAFKECRDLMIKELDKVKPIEEILKGMVDKAQKAEGEERKRLLVQYANALPKLLPRIHDIKENYENINHRNKSPDDPLRLKIKQCLITSEDQQKYTSPFFIKQAEASNIIKASLEKIWGNVKILREELN